VTQLLQLLLALAAVLAAVGLGPNLAQLVALVAAARMQK
jgi:hypothetical protein